MINDYTELYSTEEINLFSTIQWKINDQLNKILSNNYNYEELSIILEYEINLKPYAFRCWNFEFENGCQYISWFKSDELKKMPLVISSTFSDNVNDPFCDSRYGISYRVSEEGFLGACNKDAATLIEDSTKASIYTLGKTSDGRLINSYNLATPIITPIQVFGKSSNDFKSKYNEIILDSRYIYPIKVVYTNENDLDMVTLISCKYDIPIEYKTPSK